MTNPTELCTGTISDGYGVLRYCRNHSIYSNNSNVTRAIILVHGSQSNAKTQYYDLAVAKANELNVNLAETDIIAPQFFRRWNNDPTSVAIYEEWEAANYYSWGSGWQIGADALNDNRATFDVLDHIVEELMDHRPNLETIIIAGQSAGGQLVDRYSVTTDTQPSGVDIRYWVANSGSFLWQDSTRPESTAGCSDYNNYPNGLSNLGSYRYTTGKSASSIQLRSVIRDIYWTVGELDPTGVYTACKYTVQGDSTVNRWYNHAFHMYAHCLNMGGASSYCWNIGFGKHVILPGASHGFADSLDSSMGQYILFN